MVGVKWLDTQKKSHRKREIQSRTLSYSFLSSPFCRLYFKISLSSGVRHPILYVRKDQHKFDQEIVFGYFVSKFSGLNFLVNCTSTHVQVQYTDLFSFLTSGRRKRNFSDPHDYFELYVSMDMKVVIKFLKSRIDFFSLENRSTLYKDFTLRKNCFLSSAIYFPFQIRSLSRRGSRAKI
jgi:hypothetical protein